MYATMHGSSGDDVNSFETRIKELLAGVSDQQTFCNLRNDSLFR